jgi:hypothetical protein
MFVVATSLIDPVAAQGMAVLGMGNETCADWFDERYEDGHELHMEWINGYLTGFNDFFRSSGNVTAGQQKYALEYMIDEFCGQRLLSTILEASRSAIGSMEAARE